MIKNHLSRILGDRRWTQARLAAETGIRPTTISHLYNGYESDLLALLDEDTAAALTTCNCKEKCVAGQVNTDCPVCKTNMSECTGTAPVTPEPDKDAETDVPAPKPEKKSNVGMILVIFALAGAAGAAYYYIKFVKGRKPKDEDMDFFDDEGYEEEPYINEDDEPQIAEDAETDGDED